MTIKHTLCTFLGRRATQITAEVASTAAFFRFPRIFNDYWTVVDMCDWIAKSAKVDSYWRRKVNRLAQMTQKRPTLIGWWVTIWSCGKEYCGSSNLRIFRMFRRWILFSCDSRISISTSSLVTITRPIWCIGVAFFAEIWYLSTFRGGASVHIGCLERHGRCWVELRASFYFQRPYCGQTIISGWG